MKTIIIMLIASFTTFTTFAQKDKGKITTFKPPMSQSNYSCPMHHDVVSNMPGKCPKCNMDLTLSKKEQMKKDVMKDYACPMHKEVISNAAGTCAKCGKALVVVDRKSSKQGHITYVCSMHPEVLADKSGNCPKCGMPLTKVKSGAKSKAATALIEN